MEEKMKKLIALILCLIMAFSLCACSGETNPPSDDTTQNTDTTKPEENPETSDAPSGIVNPVSERTSLKELNEELGGKLVSPAAMGVSDEAYTITDCKEYKIAEYSFKLNGYDYSLRFSPVMDKDISGLYIKNGTAFENAAAEAIQKCTTDEFKAARWLTIDGQYVLSIMDSGRLDDETFDIVVDDFFTRTAPGMTDGEKEALYASLEGEYSDTISQRAMAKVSAKGSDGIEVTVSWGSSASESSEWTMTAAIAEDGLFCYKDCTLKTLTTGADGQTDENVEYTDGEGFFSVVNGQLFWNGAAEEQCRDCVFEKLVKTA